MVGQGQLIQREAQVAYKALKVAKLGQEMLPFLIEGPPSLRVLLLAAQPAALRYVYGVSVHTERAPAQACSPALHLLQMCTYVIIDS